MGGGGRKEEEKFIATCQRNPVRGTESTDKHKKFRIKLSYYHCHCIWGHIPSLQIKAIEFLLPGNSLKLMHNSATQESLGEPVLPAKRQRKLCHYTNNVKGRNFHPYTHLNFLLEEHSIAPKPVSIARIIVLLYWHQIFRHLSFQSKQTERTVFSEYKEISQTSHPLFLSTLKPKLKILTWHSTATLLITQTQGQSTAPLNSHCKDKNIHSAFTSAVYFTSLVLHYPKDMNFHFRTNLTLSLQ